MSNRRKVAQSGLWSVILQWSRFGLNTVIFLILARWLSLAEIGAFAIAFAPINLLQLVQRTGFAEVVVQGQTDRDSFMNTIFWMSAAFGCVMAMILFGLSFVIGPIVNSESSAAYLTAMAIIPALIGLAAVPEGLLRQQLGMRTLAIRTTVSLTLAGILALLLGFVGYGGWALASFAIVNALLSSILVIVLVRWVPTSGPSLDEARRVLPVLIAISGRGLATNSTIPILQLMIGAALGPVAAGAFQIAQRFLTLAATVTLTPLRFAALPVFVQVRDDADRLRRVMLETAGLVSLVSAPIYFGLLAVAPVLLPLAVGEENGSASVLALQAFLLLGGTVGLYAVFTQVLTAIGRSDVAFHWSIGLFVLNMGIGAFAVFHSAALTALSYSLLGYVAAPFILKVLSTHTGASPKEMATAVFAPVIAAAAMAVAILFFGRVFAERMNSIVLLAAEIALGTVIYVGVSFMISRKQIMTTRSLLVTLLPKRFQA